MPNPFKNNFLILFFVMFVTGALVCMTSTVYAQGNMAANSQTDTQKVKGREYHTLDLISNIDTYNINDKRLRLDSAKAHYNMGNIYYYKGEYEIAAREYYQAVTLMPNDPDAHFNLAFVSGTQLKDYRTALKHYKMYLYLKPNAEDRPFVNEKILEAQLALRGKIDSPLEKDVAGK